MKSFVKGILVVLFMALTGFFVYFLMKTNLDESSGYTTAVWTGAIFLIVILGIVGISYFANRGNSQ
jgi:hypothetical protein